MSNLANVTAYKWYRDGVDTGVTTATYGVTMASDMGAVLTCETVSDEGTLTSPGLASGFVSFAVCAHYVVFLSEIAS